MAGVVTMVALAGGGLVAAVALAHDKAFPNSVTVANAGRLGPAVGVYSGRVQSPHPRCRRVREVQVYRTDVTPEVRLFTTRTKPGSPGGGHWRRKGPALPDGAKVYALIETKVLRSNAAHDHTCPVDRSPVRTIPYP